MASVNVFAMAGPIRIIVATARRGTEDIDLRISPDDTSLLLRDIPASNTDCVLSAALMVAIRSTNIVPGMAA